MTAARHRRNVVARIYPVGPSLDTWRANPVRNPKGAPADRAFILDTRRDEMNARSGELGDDVP
jgi:hypothetical protein